MTEALRVEAAHFVRCLEEKQQPITDGHAGLRVVQILEAATRVDAPTRVVPWSCRRTASSAATDAPSGSPDMTSSGVR